MLSDLVPTAGTVLERRLSRQLIDAGPSVRRLRRGATLRAVTSCRVAVVPDGGLDREALAELAVSRRVMPAPAA